MSQQVAAEGRIAPLTVEQVHAMIDAGILEDGAPIELIEGQLVYKDRSAWGEAPMTVGKKHNLIIKLLMALDPELKAYDCHMQVQGPVTLSAHSEPEPDGAVVRGAPRDYADRLPRAEDVFAMIEVSDSSLRYDRSKKLALYARAGIAQYVIVNIVDACAEVHEQPIVADARYASVVVVRAGEPLALRVSEASRVTIDCARILP
jgi:Uma2 family endonuclease